MHNQDLIDQIDRLVDEHLHAELPPDPQHPPVIFKTVFTVHVHAFENFGDQLATALYSAGLFQYSRDYHDQPKGLDEWLENERGWLEFMLHQANFLSLKKTNEHIAAHVQALSQSDQPVLQLAGLHFRLHDHPQLFRVLANLFHQKCREAYQSALTIERDRQISNLKAELYQLFLTLNKSPGEPGKHQVLAEQFWSHAKLLKQQYPLQENPESHLEEDHSTRYVPLAVAVSLPVLIYWGLTILLKSPA